MRKPFTSEPVLLSIATSFSILPYLNTLHNAFVNWDDPIIILRPAFLRTLSLHNLIAIFRPFPIREDFLPVRDLSYAICFHFWGPSPLSFHVVNILFHTATTIALLYLVTTLFKGRTIAFLAALLFACHPIHVESVSWLSGRKDVLSGFFVAASLLSYICFCQTGATRSVQFYLLSVLCFLLALLSKASAVVLLALIPLYVWIFEPRQFFAWKSLWSYGCLFLVGALYTWGQLFIAANEGVSRSFRAGGPVTVVRTNLLVLWEYYRLLLWPVDQRIIYDLKSADHFNATECLSLLVFIVLASAFVRLRRTQPMISFSIGWFFLTLLPYLNFVPTSTLLAERYLYLPSFGFALLCAVGIGRLAGEDFLFSVHPAWRKRASWAVTIALVFAYTLCTVRYNQVWANSETLWKHQVSLSPGNPASWLNLAETYEIENRLGEAEQTYLELARRFPNIKEGHSRIGRLYRSMNQRSKAEQAYRRALALDPNYELAYNNLGEIYESLGNKRLAAEMYRSSYQANPRYVLGAFNYARLLEDIGQYEDALILWEKTYELSALALRWEKHKETAASHIQQLKRRVREQ
ncbi:MAG: tetratricopeptide repeat protein [Acidobacteria bacterium]|nr:tetratricopeptide repeat protein [Acidobacteriota bacterium]MCI0721167.1 tetratricopeptide repeat protein [Acidobacteriota bacterium]